MTPEWNRKLNAQQFGPFVIRKHVLGDMRDWASDSTWAEHDDDPDFVGGLSDEDIIRGVERHHEGGIRGFLEGY